MSWKNLLGMAMMLAPVGLVFVLLIYAMGLWESLIVLGLSAIGVAWIGIAYWLMES